MEFHSFKNDVAEIFSKLNCTYHSLNDEIGSINKENPILKESNITDAENDVKEICDNLKINIEMITRNKMKCVFFGKTSNGKSATINAILGESVLPSDIGRTTSCFITVEGCDERTGYILDEKNQRRPIEDICDLANELDDSGRDISSEIKLFWPKSRCDFLQSEIKLLDSPGVDYSPKNNRWIESYCQDADIFVYVVDGGSTINESERVFFRRVKYLLKTPKIIIVMNKWDQCIRDKSLSDVEKLKEQHRETSRKFICDDLKLHCDMKRMLFFISATEALNSAVSHGSSSETDQFTDFVRVLDEELSRKAIVTKFQPHLNKGKEYIEKALNILEERLPVEREKFSQILQSDLKLAINVLIKRTFEEIRKIAKSNIESQHALLSPSIVKGNDADQYDKMASECAEKFIIKVLQDTFKENIGELSVKIRNEFAKYCRCEIFAASLEQYIHPVFNEYIMMFEKDIHRQVYFAANKLKMNYGNQASNKDGSPNSILSTWTPVLVPMVTAWLMDKFKTNPESAKLISENLQKNINDEKISTEKKKEVNPIPDYYLKPIITDSLMQFVNQTEKDIESGANTATSHFIDNADEINKHLKSFEMIKKKLLEIKVLLQNAQKNLDDLKTE